MAQGATAAQQEHGCGGASTERQASSRYHVIDPRIAEAETAAGSGKKNDLEAPAMTTAGRIKELFTNQPTMTDRERRGGRPSDSGMGNNTPRAGSAPSPRDTADLQKKGVNAEAKLTMTDVATPEEVGKKRMNGDRTKAMVAMVACPPVGQSGETATTICGIPSRGKLGEQPTTITAETVTVVGDVLNLNLAEASARRAW